MENQIIKRIMRTNLFRYLNVLATSRAAEPPKASPQQNDSEQSASGLHSVLTAAVEINSRLHPSSPPAFLTPRINLTNLLPASQQTFGNESQLLQNLSAQLIQSDIIRTTPFMNKLLATATSSTNANVNVRLSIANSNPSEAFNLSNQLNAAAKLIIANDYSDLQDKPTLEPQGLIEAVKPAVHLTGSSRLSAASSDETMSSTSEDGIKKVSLLGSLRRGLTSLSPAKRLRQMRGRSLSTVAQESADVVKKTKYDGYIQVFIITPMAGESLSDFLARAWLALEQKFEPNKVYMFVEKAKLYKKEAFVEPGHITSFMTDENSCVVPDSFMSLRNNDLRLHHHSLEYCLPRTNTISTNLVWAVSFLNYKVEFEKYVFEKTFKSKAINQLLKHFLIRLPFEKLKILPKEFLNNIQQTKKAYEDKAYILCKGKVDGEDVEPLNCVSAVYGSFDVIGNIENPSPQMAAWSLLHYFLNIHEPADQIEFDTLLRNTGLREDIEIERNDIDKLTAGVRTYIELINPPLKFQSVPEANTRTDSSSRLSAQIEVKSTIEDESLTVPEADNIDETTIPH